MSFRDYTGSVSPFGSLIYVLLPSSFCLEDSSTMYAYSEINQHLIRLTGDQIPSKMADVDAVEAFIVKLESEIDVPGACGDNVKQRWFSLLSTMAAQGSKLVSYNEAQIVARLRVLDFRISQSIIGVQSYCVHENFSLRMEECSFCFWESELFPESKQGIFDFREEALQLFLSPFWLSFSTEYREEDVGLLVVLMGRSEKPSLSASRAMLRAACTAFPGEECTFGLSTKVLHLLSATLHPENIGKFSQDGTRSCLPHFIPHWLESVCESSTIKGEAFPVFTMFFSEYKHCFRQNRLASDLFVLFVTTFAIELESVSSELQYLAMIREIEAEVTLRQDELNRNNTCRPPRGRPICAIMIAAKIVLFLAKLSYEVAVGAPCVLTGVHRVQANLFLEGLMNTPNADWSTFFMSRIIALRGEGTLISCLREDGVLGQSQWAASWRVCIPGPDSSAAVTLQEAEKNLVETIVEEERKAREFVLCPHCRQPFIVDQANCGQFVCGSDAHTLQGRPQLNGVLVNEVYGCGRNFSIGNALPYCTDQHAVARCETEVAQAREALTIYHNLWTRAKNFETPIFPQFASESLVSESVLPTKCLIDQQSSRHRKDIHLLKTYWKTRCLAGKMEILPDLVEVCNVCDLSSNPHDVSFLADVLLAS